MTPNPLAVVVEANSASDAAIRLRHVAWPESATQRAEFSTLLSWSYSSVFAELLNGEGPISIRWGEDPPDFAITTASGRTSVEITRFTTPQSEVYRRERSGSGAYTSTLRRGKPDRLFRTALREGTLPDDSHVRPHFESLTGLDADYLKAAGDVLAQKQSDLIRYRDAYQRHWLVVQDKLSEFAADLERRLPELRRMVAALSGPRFDAVILVDGNHHTGVHAAKF
jgi:hypothetical protein